MPGSKKEQQWTTPRAFPRFLLDIRIVSRGRETLHGRTKDLGEGGLGATMAGSINIGEVVEVEFQLPRNNESLRLQAEVRYRQGFQYGLKFLHITDQQREFIRQATRNLPPAP
ncbi:MAG TPA: PilZ domain-containing protein [Candidatus Angelobacter sp.]|nr:PilZ domain-containing protein [Candidatus Angelobacter sp.]